MPPFDFNPTAQPPVGTVDPTKLYVDRQSRQLWLGVDTSVDPTGSVLVSDIMGLLAYADQAEADANAFTTAQVATKAPLAHTHVHTDITDFTTAVQAVIAATPAVAIPPGLIAQYSGLISDIGVGAWAGWRLCDGTGGTPDLRDKFVLGAGNIATGTNNAAANFNVDTGGGHSHGGLTGAHSVTVAELPSHTHASGTLNGVTSSGGSHTHNLNNEVNKLTNLGAGGVWTVFAGSEIGPQTVTISSAGVHTHSVDVNAGATAATGTGAGHTHAITSDPGHVHTVTAVSNRIRNALNWYALAYVIKL